MKTTPLIFKMDETMIKNNKISLTDIAALVNMRRYGNNHFTEFRYMKNMESVLGVSDRTIKTSIKELKEINVIGQSTFRNRYSFATLDEKFILVSNKIFESGLNAKEIGFLIKAKAKAFNNGLTKGNKEKLAEILGISSSQFNKIFNSLIEKVLLAIQTANYFKMVRCLVIHKNVL